MVYLIFPKKGKRGVLVDNIDIKEGHIHYRKIISEKGTERHGEFSVPENKFDLYPIAF